MRRAVGYTNIAAASVGSGTMTLLQINAATNHPCEIVEVGVGFNGTVATHEPRKVELLHQTDAGTMSALTPEKYDSSDGDTLDTTAQHTATAEPTAGNIIQGWLVHPQTEFVWQAPPGKGIKVGAGDRIGLRTVGDGANTHDCSAYIVFDE